MRKTPPELGLNAAPFVIGLGPGFLVGRDCHAVVETNRGHAMGRVLWQGAAEEDTAIPEAVASFDLDRVLRSPADGIFQGILPLASAVKRGERIATVGEEPLTAPFDGVLRGLLHDGLQVEAGMKVGDLDPRGIAAYCKTISDKSRAVGGGVLEALLSRGEIRLQLGC
jgi:xanthine dehydrogenase accessory factor